jgi:putative ABC transport system permease protein
MDQLLNDVRQGARRLAAAPGFTAVVLATLGIGIGANAAIFGLMDQVMFRLLPVAHPERLVVVDAPGPFSGRMSNSSATLTPMSQPMYESLRDHNTVFSGVLAHRAAEVHLSIGAQTELVDADLVSGSYFQVLGLAPAVGRLFGPEDDGTPGAHPVVVLDHRFFKERFGADPSVVGRTLGVNGHPMTVVGVAPEGFDGIEIGRATDLFVPLAMQPQVLPTWGPTKSDWRSAWLTAVARLKDGVSVEQAAAGVNVLYAQLLQEDVKTRPVNARTERTKQAFLEKKLDLLPGGRGTSDLREQAQAPLLVLMGMVGLVLLIVCANVASLLLARGSSRQKELAVRLALGAGRRRLVQQLLAESLVLSLAGGAIGVLMSAWISRALIASLPYAGAVKTLSADPDLRVGLFAFALAVATGVLFGIIPALQATRVTVSSTLKNEAGAVIGGSAHFRFRRGLVVAQIALSLLLLVGAGLFTRSLQNLRALDPGFQPDRLVAFAIDPSLNGYDVPARRGVYARVRQALAAEPGVRSVSMSHLPFMTDSDASSTISIAGREPKDDEDWNPNFALVGPDFVRTLGLTLVAGRDIAETDGPGTPNVAVVNESFARRYFPGEAALGRRFSWARPPIEVEIVGVVKDGKAASLREETRSFFYAPLVQQERVGGLTYYVRAAGDPEPLFARIHSVVRGVDPALPVTELKTMRAQIGESLFVDRMVAALSAAFGVLATLLAALGLYGVMAFAVALRTREIGIRMALGAERGDVMKMVLRDVAVLVALGVALGLPGGYGIGRVIESQLFGLNARDPLTYATATATLLLASLLAGYVPARRATRVDPMVALRA